MANIKISDLTAASVAADANEFEINEAGTSKKVTGSQIKAYVNSADGALASKNTVATADIDNLAVTEAKLADNSVTSAKIANGTITGTDIATDTITATNIAANAVGASELDVSGNGTAGQALTSDGDGTFSWADAGGGGYIINRVTSYGNSSTWTKQPNTELVSVIAIGGGGMACAVGINLNNQNMGGGGGGGMGSATFNIAQSGNTQAITVGAGGTITWNNPGNTLNRANGNAGGQSKFGNIVVANGGAAAVNNVGGAGGNGAINVPAITTATGGGGAGCNNSGTNNVLATGGQLGGRGYSHPASAYNNQTYVEVVPGQVASSGTVGLGYNAIRASGPATTITGYGGIVVVIEWSPI